MNPSDAPHPARPPRLLGSVATKVKIGVGSALVLVAGALLAPRAERKTLTAPQEHAAPLLEEQVQLRELARPFTGVQGIADRVRQHGVGIARSGEPRVPIVTDYSTTNVRLRVEGFGVFISERQILTHADTLDGRSWLQVRAPHGSTLEARVTAYEPGTGLVLLETASGGPPATTAKQAAEPGARARDERADVAARAAAGGGRDGNSAGDDPDGAQRVRREGPLDRPAAGPRRVGIVLAAVVIFEIVGPLLTRRALLVTGEAQTIPSPLEEAASADEPA